MDERSTIADLERRLAASERAARALGDSERLYRALFENTATAVTIRSLENQSFVDCNQAALRLYRAESVERLQGSTVGDLSAETQPDGTPSFEALREHVAAAIRNGSQRCEWRARRLDGEPFVADVRIAILELEGGRRVMQTIIEDITERKAAETALERRAARDTLFARISRRLIEQSVPSAVEYAIASLAEFIGTTPARVAERLLSPIAESATRRLDGAGERDDDGLVALVREMAALAQARADAEAALRAGEERYRSLVERSHDAIVSVDLDGRVTFASPAADRLFGYSNDEWLTMELKDVIVPEEQERLRTMTELARTGTLTARGEWSVIHKNGTVVRVESVRSAIHDKTGALVGAQLIVRDATERHRAEQMREAAAVELARAREDAVAASRAKSAFVANMSHELRTPLNGVIGMVDLLARTPLDVRQKRYVDVARSSASLLLSVINDILDFSKIEAGKLELEHIEFSFSDLVEEVATVMELSAEDKGLELTCQTDANLESLLVGDPARIRQVLVNLTSNAIKFTSEGEVAVRAALVSDAGAPPLVRVDVRDTGVGIAPDARQKLFQPFSQVDASTTREHGGTGLGLAICRELVQRMGGQIGVESARGRGSNFWFTLRLEYPAAGFTPSAPPADSRLSGLRILAVDDNATNREVLRAQLVAAGTRCEVARSGGEALERLAAAADEGDPFVLAVLDQQMPGMDGFELARRIKADARLAGTRLIMLGSIGQPLDPVALHALGVLTWTTKPIWRSQLLRTLGAALDDDPGTAEASPESRRAAVADDAEAASSRRPKRVLLVEDTPINAEVFAEILRAAGYDLEVVADGLGAVDAARRGVFDVILMDCQLPGLDGYEATRRIRALESTATRPGEPVRRVPILALTASATVEDMERARLAGMDDHVTKPVDARRLLAAIAEHGQVAPDRPRAAGDVTPVVELSRALARLQDNRDLLERMIGQFDGEAALARRGLAEAIERRDASAVRYVAHRLRGQALALEATPLATALARLEDLGADGARWDATAETIRSVEREMDRLARALARR